MSVHRHRQSCRLPAGGAVDRDRTLGFLFNGCRYEGHPGDTLASALLANGVLLQGRSLKFHRPRGVLSLGPEDPSVMVTVGVGPRVTPGCKASEIELYDGLIAHSVHCWPSVRFDAAAVNGWLGGLLPAGFMHKAFKAPASWWAKIYEPALRWAAGWGDAPDEADRDRYDQQSTRADVVVVGGGPAGIAAALREAQAGHSVVLIEQDSTLGGSAWMGLVESADVHPDAWIAARRAELAALPNVQVLTRTTALAVPPRRAEANGHALYVHAVERCTDHLGPQIGSVARRQRMWHVRTEQVILACGWQEQPVLFTGNDRPGVMLSGALLAALRRWAVVPGRRLVVTGCDDRAYQAALTAAQAGMAVVAVVDARPLSAIPDVLRQALEARGIPLLSEQRVRKAFGVQRVRAVQVVGLSSVRGRGQRLACDVVAMAGGCAPDLSLWQSNGGAVQWDQGLAGWRASAEHRSAWGTPSRDGVALAEEDGVSSDSESAAMALIAAVAADPRSLGWGPGSAAFVDWQGDVTAGDLALAVREGLDHPQLAKRYTSLGMGGEQGRTSALNGYRLLSALTGLPAGACEAPVARAPVAPVALAVLAGGRQSIPTARLTALYDWHQAQAKTMRSIGGWLLPACYPKPGEAEHQAIERECRAARDAVTLYDASSLGKIDVQGPDAAAFLGRIFTQPVETMGIGRVRYGMMLNQHGFVLADGTVSRLAEQHYIVSTMTRSAGTVYRHLLACRDQIAPAMLVSLADVSEHWATITLGGPRARDVLARVAPGLYLGPKAFPTMSLQDAAVAGMPARVARVSFTGELAYEISLPANRALSLWYTLLEAGAAYGITPLGISSLEVLRAEKGYLLVGHETDGMVTPDDLGYGHLVSERATGFVGQSALSLPALSGALEPRRQLVGLLSEDPRVVLPTGAQVVPERGAAAPMDGLGYVTSSYYSPTMGRSIALAMVSDGRKRHGERLHIPLEEGRWVSALVSGPVFFDQQEKRRDG